MYKIIITKEKNRITVALTKKNWFFLSTEVTSLTTTGERKALAFVSSLMKEYSLDDKNVVDKSKILIK